MGRILWSECRVRFADCDPMQHLYSGNYFRYFLDAREDQILEAYGLDLNRTVMEEGVAWVVAENQIAYLRPAMVSENILISSCLISWREKFSLIEFLMYNEDKSEIKALQWTHFAFMDVRKRRAVPHTEKYQKLFSDALQDISQESFDERFGVCRAYNRGGGVQLYKSSM